MSNRIAESFIQDLVLRTDIVQLIDGYVPLKKAGRNFVACCPFHSEKTPSFSVNGQKQFYHCFGCGVSGNVISFLMEYAHKNFVEAVEMLAARLGLSIPQGEYSSKQTKHTPLYDVLRAAMDFYRHELAQDPKALNYLQQRGIDAETAQRFALGSAADQWDRLYNHLINKNFSSESIAAAGLSVRSERNGREYDRFRGRVMFPIRDRRGRPLGFGGRSMDAETQPKYLNSPETPVFHKGGELYGLYEAEQLTRNLEYLIIVEGYMDVIALSQQGIVNVVATLGTATTSAHMQRVFRLTSRVIFCFDGDNAGQKAAWRALEAALPVLNDGCEVRFIFLPADEDPDSLVRKQGKEAFNAYVDNALPLSDFFFNHLSLDLNVETPDGRARLASLATPLLEKMPLGVFRTLMLDELAKKTRLSANSVQKIVAVPDLPAYKPADIASVAHKTPLRLGLTLLIQHPHLVQYVENKAIFNEVTLPGIELFALVVEYLQTHPKQTTATLLEHWRDTAEGRILERLAAEELIIPETGIQAEFKDIWLYLQKLAIEQTIEALQQKLATVGLSDEEKRQLMQLMIQQQKNNK